MFLKWESRIVTLRHSRGYSEMRTLYWETLSHTPKYTFIFVLSLPPPHTTKLKETSVILTSANQRCEKAYPSQLWFNLTFYNFMIMCIGILLHRLVNEVSLMRRYAKNCSLFIRKWFGRCISFIIIRLWSRRQQDFSMQIDFGQAWLSGPYMDQNTTTVIPIT